MISPSLECICVATKESVKVNFFMASLGDTTKDKDMVHNRSHSDDTVVLQKKLSALVCAVFTSVHVLLEKVFFFEWNTHEWLDGIWSAPCDVSVK